MQVVSSRFNQVSIKDGGGPSLKNLDKTVGVSSSNAKNISNISNSIGIRRDAPNNKKTVELFEFELSNEDNSFTFNSETLKMYISYVEDTRVSLEKKINDLEKKYNSFISPGYPNPSKYPNLVWYNSYYCTPEHLKDPWDFSIIRNFRDKNPSRYGNECFPGGDEDAYQLLLKDYQQWVDTEYTEQFNKLMKEQTGFTLEEYNAEMEKMRYDLLQIQSSSYALRQQSKQLPYLKISESYEYKKYVSSYKKNNVTIKMKYNYFAKVVYPELYVNGEKKEKYEVNPLDLEEALKSVDPVTALYFTETMDDIKYLTDDEKMMYSFLFETKGRTDADKYIEAIKDAINERRGRAEAESFIKSISDQNGVIQRNLWTGALTAGKGVIDGIETFGDGWINLIKSDGVMTSNQYAQMYILEALGTQGIMDDTYQLGSSFGNMLPSMVASMIISYIATPAVGSILGNILMGGSSAGNAINQKKIEGDDSIKAVVYGLAMGVSETTLGLLLGNIPFLNANSALSIKGLLSEGLEEFTQTYVEAGMNAVMYGEDVDAAMLFGEASKSFIYGVIMSGITNGGQLGFNLITNTGASVKIKNINDFLSYISLNNNSDVNIVKNEDGGKTIIINSDTDVEPEFINKIKNIFPDCDIVQKFDDNTKTILAKGEIKATDGNVTSGGGLKNIKVENISNDASFNGETVEKVSDSSNKITNNLQYLNEEVKKANYYTEKGNFYTIDVSSFDNIPSDIWSQINDPSNVRFRCDGEIYSFLDAKGKAGADPIENITSNNTTAKEKVTLEEFFNNKASEANYYASKGNFYSISVESFDNIPNDFWTKINDPSQLFIVKDGKRFTFAEAKALSEVDTSVNSVKAELSKVDYGKSNPLIYSGEYLKSNVRKYFYKDTNSFEGLNNQIMQNGLYHFTSAADAILSSGYIKASDMQTSYGNKKTFFFNGVPEVGAFATNLDSIPLKTTAVRVQPTTELVNDSKLKVRYTDDMAITYDGKFDLAGFGAEKCYFVLDVSDGKLSYKQVSEEVYNHYENTNVGKTLSEYASNKRNVAAVKNDYLTSISLRNANAKVADSSNVASMLDTTVKNDNMRHVLDNLINEYGSVGRRKLALYASTGSIVHIPVEFRAHIQNISQQGIKSYLNPKKEHIGIQYFGGTSVSGNSNMNNGQMSIETLQNDLKTIIYLHNQIMGDRVNYTAESALMKIIDPSNINYGRYQVISSNGGARNILQKYTMEQIAAGLVSMGYDVGNAKVDYSILNTNVNENMSFSNLTSLEYMSSISKPQLSDNIGNVMLNLINGRKNQQNAYSSLVLTNCVKKSAPSNSNYYSFFNRFSNISEVSGDWQHTITNRGMLKDIEHRLYINTDFDVTYKFLQLFADKCEQKGLDYYFKTAANPSGNYLLRSESAVIYSSEEMIPYYTSICQEIRNEHPELYFYDPPVATSTVDGWLGYGAEPTIETKRKLYAEGIDKVSFNVARAFILDKAIDNSIISFVNKFGNSIIYDGKTTNQLYIDSLYFSIVNTYKISDSNQQIELYNYLTTHSDYFLNCLSQGGSFMVGGYTINDKMANAYMYYYVSAYSDLFTFMEQEIKKLSFEYGIDPNNFAINISN